MTPAMIIAIITASQTAIQGAIALANQLHAEGKISDADLAAIKAKGDATDAAFNALDDAAKAKLGG